MNRKKIYWICQISGWLLFVLLNSLFIQLNDAFNARVAISLSFTFVIVMASSHLYRNLIIKFDWLRLNILKLIPRFLIASLVLSAIYFLFQTAIVFTFFNDPGEWPDLVAVVTNVLNVAFVYVVWSLVYFLVHFIENYKKEEIKNLKWEAAINEIELNKLKSQLNPHFMFNSMNSIRALVDEDPFKAKNAITQLSNILRNTLQMGKNKLISFEEELNLIKDYLDLEVTRYEERLRVEYDIHPQSAQFNVPPMMIQTLVENAIKHGISKLPEGGVIKMETKIKDNCLHIKIINSGQMNIVESETGFGIKNTVQRLSLLYNNKAIFKINNLDNKYVITELIIPPTHESFNH